MKIAIHHNNWPSSFSTYWIQYCVENGIDYKIVDCFSTDIVSDLHDCNALMWHHSHDTFMDAIAAKKILFAIEHSGKIVFPSFNTDWHFDDKVAQKYLLEAVNASVVPSSIFYDKKKALEWANTTTFPKVFKLKGGSGSKNVQLVGSKSKAETLINKAFGGGFSQFNRANHFNYYLLRYKKTKQVSHIVKAFGGLIVKSKYGKMQHNEKGYVYFQEFIENDGFDLRIIIVGDKGFGLKRLVRENDFRASGSGNIIYDVTQIDENCVKMAFEINKKIKSQSIAFDFVIDKVTNVPYIVEISYAYAADAYKACEGYWTDDLKFHPGSFNPQGWMVEDIIKQIKISG
ncbi:ATP-grasp domain-containing protein [Pedobacter psychroterrae]|uniref:ATP-grasp fold RimK-type domain-containing protein n=1 Tax=Pedobacter psychroterrae TaxID=2530453 RepID=A0A4R0NP11_9SPHI|nr:hypothetical protein [Pedobacter psychroterrae]TCD02700.1 hypothetical protein EZ437_01550 [Pedobacter psychroterrae]